MTLPEYLSGERIQGKTTDSAASAEVVYTTDCFDNNDDDRNSDEIATRSGNTRLWGGVKVVSSGALNGKYAKKIRVKLHVIGNATGDLVGQIRSGVTSGSSGQQGTNRLTSSNTIDLSTIQDSTTFIEFTFDGSYAFGTNSDEFIGIYWSQAESNAQLSPIISIAMRWSAETENTADVISATNDGAPSQTDFEFWTNRNTNMSITYDEGSTPKDKTTITNVQAGTRYEEVDTKKIFSRREQSGGAGAGNYAWVEKGSTAPSLFRGLVGCSNNPDPSDFIDYFTIQTLGDAQDFGNLTVSREGGASCADATRGVFAGGAGTSSPNSSAVMDYVTVATVGNATTFGTMAEMNLPAGLADATRGLFASGNLQASGINYITIATTGNSSDFGDMTQDTFGRGGCASETRGIICGGNSSNVIEYVTIQTTGNATDFGDLSTNFYTTGACDDLSRGCIAGGTSDNRINYFTIASTGNASDFGDLTRTTDANASCSDRTRGCWAGGGSSSDVIDYVTIQTTGNASDFGDLNVGRGRVTGCSA